jgi:hypothetical protein
MATRIETLGGSRRAPKAVWILFIAIVLLAVVLGVGTMIGSGDGTTTPVRSPDAAAITAREAATQSSGLIKGGLQPRPYSGILVEETAPVVAPKIPDGFVQLPGGELRPKFGG